MSSKKLPKPGEIVHLDFRQSAPKAAKSCGEAAAAASPIDADQAAQRPLKLLQWNIERGHELDKVITQLQEIDADILSLQEIDICCERSGCRDTGALIAEALGLNHLFVCEFTEKFSTLRDSRSQGGGVHGNAVLTKFDFLGWHIVEHSHHPIDWNAEPSCQPHPLAAKEPREGRRLTLAADVDTPQGQLRVYCCHLEVFCGILSRVWQFSDILVDARRHASKQQQQQQQRANSSSGSSSLCCQAILGDLNTMAHGVARLSPNYACDVMRWRSIGSSEAGWWQQHVLSVMDPCTVNQYLHKLGLPLEVAQAAVNPGFFDPFDVEQDITLDNPAYQLGPFHLMAGKLDWVLLRGMTVLRKRMGNEDYAASDHKWLLVEVQLLRKDQQKGGCNSSRMNHPLVSF